MSLRLLSAKQCAEALSISMQSWWRWVAAGKAPQGHKISEHRTAWRSDDIEDLINQVAPRRQVNA